MYNQNEIPEICGVGYPDHDADSVVGNGICWQDGWLDLVSDQNLGRNY